MSHTPTRKRTAKDDQVDRIVEVLSMANYNCGLSPDDLKCAKRMLNSHAAMREALEAIEAALPDAVKQVNKQGASFPASIPFIIEHYKAALALVEEQP